MRKGLGCIHKLLPAALPCINEFLALPNYREAMGYIDVPQNAELSDYDKNAKKLLAKSPVVLTRCLPLGVMLYVVAKRD